MRLDLFLVQKHLAKSRTQAQGLIESGFVFIKRGDEKIQLKKASYEIDETMSLQIIVEDNLMQKYVSRAGLKLESAIRKTDLNLKGLTVLDIGQSTGGFTDCLLQHGATKIVGIDVGHDQLHAKLKKDERVVCFEGLNAKNLASEPVFLAQVPLNKFDLIVMDVSFISISKVIPFLAEFLKSKGKYLFLVKPQFECGPSFLDKNGIVNDAEIYKTIENNIRKVVIQYFGDVELYFESGIAGKDGNREFFIHGQKTI